MEFTNGWLGDWENGMERVWKHYSLFIDQRTKPRWHLLVISCSTHHFVVDEAFVGIYGFVVVSVSFKGKVVRNVGRSMQTKQVVVWKCVMSRFIDHDDAVLSSALQLQSKGKAVNKKVNGVQFTIALV